MHYFIDGYNLLFQTIYSQSDEELKVQRLRLIEDLASKIKGAKLQATLVFDSQFNPRPSERKILNELDVHFTNEGETADEYILHAISSVKTPQIQTVVTNDKGLSTRARQSRASSLSIKEFTLMLSRIYSKKLRKKEPIEKKEPLISKKPPTLHEHYAALFEAELEPEPKSPSTKQTLLRFETDEERWEREFNRNLDDV